jgi:hypothetical protein
MADRIFTPPLAPRPPETRARTERPWAPYLQAPLPPVLQRARYAKHLSSLLPPSPIHARGVHFYSCGRTGPPPPGGRPVRPIRTPERVWRPAVRLVPTFASDRRSLGRSVWRFVGPSGPGSALDRRSWARQTERLGRP